MPLEGLDNRLGDGFPQQPHPCHYFQIRIVVNSFRDGMSKQLHPDHPINQQRNKDTALLVFHPSKFAAFVDQTEVKYLLCLFLGLESFLFLLLLDVVAKRYRSALGKLHIVLKF
jgi:hypothetical protein